MCIRDRDVHFVEAPIAPDNELALPGESFGVLGLAGLPATWIEQVRQAATAADAVQLLALAVQIEDTQPALAAALRAWGQEFDYGAVLNAFERI